MASTAHSAKAAADAADFGYDAFKTTVDKSIAALALWAVFAMVGISCGEGRQRWPELLHCGI